MKKYLRFWLSLIVLSVFLAGVSWGQGPLTNIMNLMGRTDSNGSLYVFGVAAGAQGPLTPIGNLRGRTYNGGDLGVVINGGTITPSIGLFGNGTLTAPSIAFASDTGTGLWRLGASTVIVSNGGVAYQNWAPAGIVLRSTSGFQWSSGDPSAAGADTGFARSAAAVVKVTDAAAGYGTLDALGYRLSGAPTFLSTAPTISGFAGSGPSAAVVAGSNTAAWRITVGGTAPGTTGTITLPTATTGWNCWVVDQTTPLDITRQTSSTTGSVVITSTIAWTAGDTLVGGCAAF